MKFFYRNKFEFCLNYCFEFPIQYEIRITVLTVDNIYYMHFITFYHEIYKSIILKCDSIFRNLTQSDAVRFHSLLTSLRTREYAMKSSGWLILDAAETLFISAKNRIFDSKQSKCKVV